MFRFNAVSEMEKNMADQITNYKCPACTGPLHFAGGSGNMECEYCGSVFSVDEIEKMYEEKNESAEKAMAGAAEKAAKAADEGWELPEEQMAADGLKAYNCPSCGAELICEDTVAASSCPYCGNPTVVPGQFSGMLKPDYVIPFKMDQNAAVDALKKHYGNRFLLPKTFKDQNHLQEVKGVYVPFWLYDGVTQGTCIFEAEIDEKHDRGDEEITITKHYHVEREGGLAFEKIPADASTKMPDDLMDSIEPYDYSELKEFKKAYLTGYLADKYDVTAEENEERALARAKASTVRAMLDDVNERDYSSVSTKSSNIGVDEGKVSYAMMPVYLLSTKWNGQNFLFAMNGQTGKMVGDLPTDKKKLSMTMILIVLASIVLSYILDMSFGAALIIGIVVATIVGFVLVSGMKSVAKATQADSYVTTGSIRITNRIDRFTHETRSVRKKN